MARFNLFEGSRRIALLLKIVWVLFIVGVAYTQTPYVSITLFTGMPGDPFTRIPDATCDTAEDDLEYITREFAPGRNVSIQLCFLAATASDGRRLIPFRMVDHGKSWIGNEKYTPEVTAYTAARARDFVLAADDRSRAAELWDERRAENLRTAIGFMLGGWIVFSVLQFVIGWIVRGFMGIPQGMDHRLEASPPVAPSA